MPKATGFAALSALTTFRATQWFTKSIATLVDEISRHYSERTEITTGFEISHDGGTKSATVLQLDVSAGSLLMAGKLNDIAAVDNKDIFAVASDGFSGAIYSNGDGEDDTNFSLGDGDTAYITIIACNSDGAGDAAASGFKMVAIIAGDDMSSLDSDHLTTAEINTALAASEGESTNYDHSGTTAWVHVAQVAYARSGATFTPTVTDNRNNSEGA